MKQAGKQRGERTKEKQRKNVGQAEIGRERLRVYDEEITPDERARERLLASSQREA